MSARKILPKEEERLRKEIDARQKIRELAKSRIRKPKAIIDELPPARASIKPEIAPSRAERPERIITEDDFLFQAMSQISMEIEASLDHELEREREEKGGPYEHRESNWISSLGHPCKLHLVFERLNGLDQKQPDIEALWRFKEGNEFERKIKEYLSRAGWEMTEAQKLVKDESLQLRGRIDGMTTTTGRLPGLHSRIRGLTNEIKSINPLFFKPLKKVEDVKSCKFWWIRKYPSQLNTYNHVLNLPGGFLTIGTFGARPRILPMILDRDLLDHDLAMIESVNNFVAAGKYPDPIPFDGSVCGMCGWSHMCQPLKATKMTRELDVSEIAALEHFLELKKWHQEYERVHAELIGGKKKPGRYYGQNAMIHDISISSASQERPYYDVPDEVKAPYKRVETINITKIERIE